MTTRAAAASRITCTVDFAAPGKRFGCLIVPYSRNESAWGAIRIPIVVMVGDRPGPTLLFTAGSHGDEYEGPIALLKLARAQQAEGLRGRVILLPTMNHPAVRSATRLSPIDGLNMNRIFPGDPRGTVTAMVADFVLNVLVAKADAVIDLHSGGKTLDFVPSAVMHDLPAGEQRERTMAALLAFGAPLAMVLTELDDVGMLDTAVESQGKVFLSAELGGVGTATAERVAITERGIANLLRHFGVTEGAPVAPSPSRLMYAPSDGFIAAAPGGLMEPLVALGSEVAAGQPVAQVHDFERPETPPRIYAAPRAGLFYARHAPGLIAPDDCLAVIASDYPG